MNKNINNGVELTEKELAGIAGGATVTVEILAKMEELAATPDFKNADERPIGVIDDPSLKFFKIKGGLK